MTYYLTEKDWKEAVQPWAQDFLEDYQHCLVLSWPNWPNDITIGEAKAARAELIDDMQFWCMANLPPESFAVEGVRRIVTYFFFKERSHMMLFKLAHA